jgi:transposase
VLGPTLQPGDIVSIDNLRAPNASGIREAIEQTGARRLSWPPYAPDLSPIERCWTKLKAYLRQATARTRVALDAAITEALITVTAADAHGWFAHPGWALR